jgi:hypothetical protein
MFCACRYYANACDHTQDETARAIMQDMKFMNAASFIRKTIADGTATENMDLLRDFAAKLIQSRWRSKVSKRKAVKHQQATNEAVLEVYAVKIQRAFRIRREIRRSRARSNSRPGLPHTSGQRASLTGVPGGSFSISPNRLREAYVLSPRAQSSPPYSTKAKNDSIFMFKDHTVSPEQASTTAPAAEDEAPDSSRSAVADALFTDLASLSPEPEETPTTTSTEDAAQLDKSSAHASSAAYEIQTSPSTPPKPSAIQTDISSSNSPVGNAASHHIFAASATGASPTHHTGTPEQPIIIRLTRK